MNAAPYTGMINGSEARSTDFASRSVLDAETLQQWQSELHDFVAHTRGRLTSLSVSLMRWQETQQAIAAETHSPVSEEEGTRVESVAEEAEPVHLAETEPVNIAPVAPPDQHEPVSDADPLTRLKLRLAQQIENV